MDPFPAEEVQDVGHGIPAAPTPKSLLEQFNHMDDVYPPPEEAPPGQGLGRTLTRGKALPNWHQASILPPNAFESPPKTPKTLSKEAQDQFHESQETLVLWVTN